MSSLENPSEGTQLAAFLDEAFRSGNFADLLNSSPAEPAVPSEEDELRKAINRYMDGFIGNLSPEALKEVEKRPAANEIRSLFAVRKSHLTKSLTGGQVADSEIEVVGRITLKDVANYASEQFERFKKDAATLPPGSDEQIAAREKSDYWSIMSEVIGPASDQD